MQKLSGKGYWDSLYRKISSREKISSYSKFRKWLKHITRDYSNYIFLDILYPKYLPKRDDFKIMEIGSAPGKYLIGFHNRYGYEPFGVEYSEGGCDINKANFKKVGLNTENVICADFFDQEFQKNHAGKYDVVFSRGFIEHFDDPSKIVDDHLNLLNDKGYVVIQIPNLRGINYYLLKFLNISSLETHNFSIMDVDAYRKAFENKGLEFLYCNYVGTFSWGLMNTNRKWKYIMHRILLLIQRPVDFLWRLIFGGHHIKYRYTSPYLLFIGRRK
jgi:SAM-dependent methyltransferase